MNIFLVTSSTLGFLYIFFFAKQVISFSQFRLEQSRSDDMFSTDDTIILDAVLRSQEDRECMDYKALKHEQDHQEHIQLFQTDTEK